MLVTKGLCIYLQADDNMCVRGHYDASYGVQNDMKSHTGACAILGNGSIYVSSCKQSIVAKSSRSRDDCGFGSRWRAYRSKRTLYSSVCMK